MQAPYPGWQPRIVRQSKALLTHVLETEQHFKAVPEHVAPLARPQFPSVLMGGSAGYEVAVAVCVDDRVGVGVGVGVGVRVGVLMEVVELGTATVLLLPPISGVSSHGMIELSCHEGEDEYEVKRIIDIIGQRA